LFDIFKVGQGNVAMKLCFMNKYQLYLFIICCISFSCKKFVTNDSGGSWELLPFVKPDSINPILIPGNDSFNCPIRNETVFWEQKAVFNPAIVVKDGKIYMLYRAQDVIGLPNGTSRIGLAESIDGFNFTRNTQPVLYPDKDAEKIYEWQGGCEDPRIVEDGSGTYYMTYTAYDGNDARLMVATSTDLMHWTKYGPVFAKAYNGKYLNEWTKSGSILSRYENGNIIATKINGTYWMYWGDQYIWVATSDDLVNWNPVEMGPNETPPLELAGIALNMPSLKIVVPTRHSRFDSDLVESGPPAMLTDSGILLIYNGRNILPLGDSSLPDGTYATGQVLLDKNNPTHILQRMDSYFMRPDQPYEISGQTINVCFVEGLANFNNKWFLYYGASDSKIAVAVRK
jgi:beta-1,2-mannosidase